MPTLQQAQPPAGLSTPNHPDHLAFRGLGTRQAGTLPNRSRRHDAFAGGGGQVHQWIEARPIKKLDGPIAVRFVKDIAVHYGMPNNIITGNDTNFAKGALSQYCSVFSISLDLAPVAHPQSNGQVKRANGLILSGIKPRLVEPLIRSPGSWLDELPAVLWTEAKEAREDGVDLLEEARLLALSRSAIYQQGLRHYQNKKIKPLAFREGDLIFRLVQQQADQHKLSSPWEGPFIVSKALCDRNAYRLIDARK
ncbi:uncharacterized protein [Aegilops tauschii subsp. strangulata]|uniref:uncharacterized protein n=1 Tax=Aegilops tauschii subsp. strangulata TaxID=200361 RepID=UPI00098B4D2C|nr:uncharacterized protein LOC109756843 [Aegilops tauschii subsp. strangulata]